HSRTVFFIDNFETLFTEEGLGVRILLRRLIRDVPSLIYLVTSSRALKWSVSEELHAIEVLPLNAAVEMFRDSLRRQSRKDETKSASSDDLLRSLCEQIGYH